MWCSGAAEECSLPLIVGTMEDTLLLPGDSRRMEITKADDLAAVEAAQRYHGCLGLLLRTPQDNALSAAPLLEIREVRKLEEWEG